MTVNGTNYTYWVSLHVGEPYGSEPQPTSLIGGPFAEPADVTYPLGCEADIQTDDGFPASFDEFNSLIDPSGGWLSPANVHHYDYEVELDSIDNWNVVNPVEGQYTCRTEFFAYGIDLGPAYYPVTLSYVNPTKNGSFEVD
jgi:hypothetical protein